jgi:hypothetical protein
MCFLGPNFYSWHRVSKCLSANIICCQLYLLVILLLSLSSFLFLPLLCLHVWYLRLIDLLFWIISRSIIYFKAIRKWRSTLSPTGPHNMWFLSVRIQPFPVFISEIWPWLLTSFSLASTYHVPGFQLGNFTFVIIFNSHKNLPERNYNPLLNMRGKVQEVKSLIQDQNHISNSYFKKAKLIIITYFILSGLSQNII